MAVPEMLRHLDGAAIMPGDRLYDTARSLWNARIDHRPAVIVRCATPADARTALAYATENRLPVSVRGGGHHCAGFAVADRGLVIDFTEMRRIDVDPVNRTASIEPGVTVAELDEAAQAHGLMTTGAPIAMLGMAGYTLGGGLGWTSRLHGLACDNLIAADVLTADMEFVACSAEQEPDLFWALRGGGGNFGIVTRFTYRLRRLGPEVLAGSVLHSMNHAADILQRWADHMPLAADEVQCMPLIVAPPDATIAADGSVEPVLVLALMDAGDLASAAERLAPIRAWGEPLMEAVAPAPYAGLLSHLDEMYRAGQRCYYRSVFFDHLEAGTIQVLCERLRRLPSAGTSIFLEPLGGAIGRVPVSATAFPHRQRRFCVTAVPVWQDPEDDSAMTGWADELFAAISPPAARGVYVNYLDRVEGLSARDAYGPNWERLCAVKQKWDPENVFRSCHNIPPA
jgi:FAD/FMN-containing dehydrogenase